MTSRSRVAGRRRSVATRHGGRPSLAPAPCVDHGDGDRTISGVVVAVPARDEVTRIGECLRSIDVAAAGVDPAVRVVVVVSADRCRDGTVLAAAAVDLHRMQRIVLTGRWRSASGARAAAVACGLDTIGAPPQAVWIANTDADCTVPPDWLARQLRLARLGVDAVAGVVRLDPRDTSDHLRARFAAHYGNTGPKHGHLHAANVGVRADAYHAAGGWRANTVVGEEHDLWARLLRHGRPVRSPASLTVTTSGRLRGRVPGGLAGVLRGLVDAPALSWRDPA